MLTSVTITPLAGAVILSVIGLVSAALGAFIASIAPRGATALAVLEAALARQDHELARLREDMKLCEAERNQDRLTFATELAELRGRVIAAHGELAGTSATTTTTTTATN